VNDFFIEMQRRKFSLKSIQCYKDRLAAFEKYMTANQITRLQDVKEEDIEAYRFYLINKKCSDNTVDLYVRCLRLLFKFLEKSGVIFINPMENIKLRKVKSKRQYIPSVETIKILLAQPSLNTATGIRDRAIIETAYSTACRISELTNLSISDLDLKNGAMTIRNGKGSKDRIVPLGKHAVKALSVYLNGARGELLADEKDTNDLWISFHHHKKMELAGINRIFHTYSKQADLKHCATVHSIRRGTATAMLRNGGNPVLIAELLGHSSLKTLGAYLDVSIEDLKTMHHKSKVSQ
jgi:site-specific recombinase XerD